MMFWLQYIAYQVLVILFTPVAFVLARKIDKSAGQNRWRERFGFYPAISTKTTTTNKPIWLHASSVGEAKLAGLLINSLRSQGYAGRFVITTSTNTGADAIAPSMGAQDQHFYAPYDLACTINRALKHFQPQLLVVFEKEIWPNMWRKVDQAGIPIIVSNANLSERSLSRYKKVCFELLKDSVARATLIMTQNAAVQDRFLTLGAKPEALQVMGNLKFALAQQTYIQDSALLRQQLGTDRPVWLAASTHEGEEADIIACQQQLLNDYPDLLLVIAPRHPQRFDAVAKLCAESGLTYVRRTETDTATITTIASDCSLYLADTLGELNGFYTAVDLAVVCGSFVEVGGHNILEPAAAGCPIIVGPDMTNSADILDDFLAANALVQIASAAELENAVAKLLQQPAQRQQLTTNAQTLLNESGNTLATQTEKILALCTDTAAVEKPL